MPNNLANSNSPYLLAHSNNPVDWYPWGDEALQKAKQENKPIFLSIGYSSCHWCHVMEKESFEDQNIANILNKHFISIKVDKEERPDIDKHFQEVYTLMNRRSGGWPASIFLTPNLKPIYSATYIPPVPRYNMTSFPDIIDIIAQKYSTQEELLHTKGEEILFFLNQNKATQKATKLDKTIATRFISQAKQLFDKTHGGFGTAPKFPQVSTYQTLLALYKLKFDDSILSMVTTSLDSIAKGGLYDRVDGGFCRYSTDEAWIVPHFEKMGYDNALICELFLDTYNETKQSHYLSILEKSINFLLDKMSQDGLFFAASDADTEGKEGEYFVFTKQEIQEWWQKANISKDDIDVLLKGLNISKNGNFEGKNIITVNDSKTAKSLPSYQKAINCLKELRKKRTYPFIDKKIITAWNAMMIKTLFKSSNILPHYANIAKNSLDSLLGTLYINNQLYHTTLFKKEPTIEAFLEDYAYLAEALIEAHQVTFEDRYLDLAQELTNSAIKKFYKNKKWYFSQGDFVTQADIYDSSYPSSLATMLNVLQKLHILKKQEYLHIVFDSLEMISYDLMRQPISSPKLTLVAIEFLYETYLIKAPFEDINIYKQNLKNHTYPFVLFEKTDDTKSMLCGDKECFMDTKNIEDILEYLENNLNKKVLND